MAWVRHGQLSAETQTLADVVMYGGAYGSSPVSISDVRKFTGGYSYRLTSSYTQGCMGVAGMNANAARLNFMFNHEFSVASGTAYMPLAGFMVSGQPVTFFMREDGTLGIRAGYDFDTLNVRFPLINVGSPASLLTRNLWVSIGAVAFFSEIGGFVSLYVDGEPAISWTGDTRIYASSSPGGATPPPLTTIAGAFGPGGGYFYGISPVGWTTAYIDDFYVDYYTGGAPADYPPATRRFVPAFPIADTATADWTPNTGIDHYAMVDEAPPDDDTTRLKADGPGLTDIFNFSTVTVPSPDWSVRAAVVVAYARKTDANFDSTLRLVQEYDGTVQESDARQLGVSYNNVFGRWEAPPGEETWTEARINQARFGIRSDGSFSDYG